MVEAIIADSKALTKRIATPTKEARFKNLGSVAPNLVKHFEGVNTGYIHSMRVRMKRRFRNGVERNETQFHAQEWVCGLLQFQKGLLYLCASTPDSNPPPYGVLYRPVLKACYSDTISFTGIEQEGLQWLLQVWFCEVGSR